MPTDSAPSDAPGSWLIVFAVYDGMNLTDLTRPLDRGSAVRTGQPACDLNGRELIMTLHLNGAYLP